MEEEKGRAEVALNFLDFVVEGCCREGEEGERGPDTSKIVWLNPFIGTWEIGVGTNWEG